MSPVPRSLTFLVSQPRGLPDAAGTTLLIAPTPEEHPDREVGSQSQGSPRDSLDAEERHVLAAVASHTLRTKERSSRMSDRIVAVPGAGIPSPAEVDASPRRTRPGIPALPPLPESDEELFKLYATTDSDRALWEIMNRYQPKILRYFSRNAATAHRAEDLTQEVFIRIVRNRASYDPNQKFSTWSKTITERIAMNAARTAQRSRVTAFSDLDQPGDARDEWDLDPVDGELLPDEAAARSEAREILEDALADVEERYREPLVLHFIEGLTHTEAARKLGIPVGTAKSRTHHAIEDLREALTRRGYAAAFT